MKLLKISHTDIESNAFSSFTSNLNDSLTIGKNAKIGVLSCYLNVDNNIIEINDENNSLRFYLRRQDREAGTEFYEAVLLNNNYDPREFANELAESLNDALEFRENDTTPIGFQWKTTCEITPNVGSYRIEILFNRSFTESPIFPERNSSKFRINNDVYSSSDDTQSDWDSWGFTDNYFTKGCGFAGARVQNVGEFYIALIQDKPFAKYTVFDPVECEYVFGSTFDETIFVGKDGTTEDTNRTCQNNDVFLFGLSSGELYVNRIRNNTKETIYTFPDGFDQSKNYRMMIAFKDSDAELTAVQWHKDPFHVTDLLGVKEPVQEDYIDIFPPDNVREGFSESTNTFKDVSPLLSEVSLEFDSDINEFIALKDEGVSVNGFPMSDVLNQVSGRFEGVYNDYIPRGLKIELLNNNVQSYDTIEDHKSRRNIIGTICNPQIFSDIGVGYQQNPPFMIDLNNDYEFEFRNFEIRISKLATDDPLRLTGDGAHVVLAITDDNERQPVKVLE